MIAARPRAMVLFDIYKANHEAQRMVCVDEKYAPKHAELNALLDELEALG